MKRYGLHGDTRVKVRTSPQRFKLGGDVAVKLPSVPPGVTEDNFRLTEDENFRITEDGDFRILE